jgi:glucosamine-6-phosphate deaminase
LKTIIADTKQEMGAQAAAEGARRVREAIARNGGANIVVATGASQFEMLQALVAQPDVRWDRVTAFHLDEYAGMEITHPASFRRYLWERFVSRLPLPLRAFHYVNAETDPKAECRCLAGLIRQHPTDVAFIGIGENGHVAFNDPPADFTSWWSSTKPAAGSSSARAGSRHSSTCPHAQSRCRSVRS